MAASSSVAARTANEIADRLVHRVRTFGPTEVPPPFGINGSVHELEAFDWVRRTDHQDFPAGGGWSARCRCGWFGRVETTVTLAEIVGRQHVADRTPGPRFRRASMPAA
jgi:hypothetical protein